MKMFTKFSAFKSLLLTLIEITFANKTNEIARNEYLIRTLGKEVKM